MRETDPERLLGSAEVAYLLGYSRQHITRLANAGELPIAQRLTTNGTRSAYLFRRADVELYAVAHLPVPPIHQQATLDELAAS